VSPLALANLRVAGAFDADQAESGEQRGNDAVWVPSMERRHRAEPVPRSLPPGPGVSRKLTAKAMSQTDSRYHVGASSAVPLIISAREAGR
jgi:hypothetical protein